MVSNARGESAASRRLERTWFSARAGESARAHWTRQRTNTLTKFERLFKLLLLLRLESKGESEQCQRQAHSSEELCSDELEREYAVHNASSVSAAVEKQH